MDWAFVLIAIPVLARGLTYFPWTASGSAHDWPGHLPWPSLLVFGVYTASLVLLGLRWTRSPWLTRDSRLLWTFVGLAVMSLIWSVDAVATEYALLFLSGATVFGMYLAITFRIPQQVWALALSAIGLAMASLLAVRLIPELGTLAGAWRGVYENPNALARLLVLGAVALAWLALDRRWSPLTGLAYVAMVPLIFMTDSLAGIAVVGLMSLFVLLLLVMVVKADLAPSMATSALLALIGATGIAVAFWERLLVASGADPGMGGRLELWPLLLGMIDRRPWLGYGWGAFWRGEASPAADIWFHLGWQPGHAHNGFLDVGLALGWVGLGLLVVLIAVTAFRAFQVGLRGNSVLAYWPLGLLLYVILWNMTESQFAVYWRHPLIWSLFVMAVVTTNHEYAKLQTSQDPDASEASRGHVTPRRSAAVHTRPQRPETTPHRTLRLRGPLA